MNDKKFMSKMMGCGGGWRAGQAFKDALAAGKAEKQAAAAKG
jgi:hypothetical protein